MRIAVFYDIFTGGAKRSVFEYSRSLRRLGHQIELYAPKTDDHFLVDDTFAEQRFDFDYRPLFDFGERTFLFSPLLWLEIPRLYAISKKLAEKIDRKEYDIVLVHNSRFTQCPAVLRYLKTPAIYYCHEPLRYVTEPHPNLEGSKEMLRSAVIFLTRPSRKVMFYLESNHLKKANLILTNSFFTMENLYRAYGIYSIPSYQGVDAETFRPLDKAKADFVLTVGQLNRWKGQEFLVKSLSYVPKEIRPPLYLVYDKCAPRYKKYIDELAGKLKVRVVHYEQVGLGKLIDLYNRARVFVYAPTMEPFGFAPLEAMACGTPVVAVKEGGIRETVEHGETGLLTHREPGHFAGALMQLITNHDLSQEIGERARQRVLDKWNWSRAARTLEKHMERLMKKNE